MYKQKAGNLTPEEKTKALARTAKLMKRRDLTKWKKFLLFACAALIISPVDALPEAVLGPIGLLDDAGMLFWSSGVMFLRHKASKQLAGVEEAEPGAEVVPATA